MDKINIGDIVSIEKWGGCRDKSVRAKVMCRSKQHFECWILSAFNKGVPGDFGIVEQGGVAFHPEFLTVRRKASRSKFQEDLDAYLEAELG